MNLRKRTLALLLTVCLLLSVVVPMASAEEETIKLQLGSTSMGTNWDAFDPAENTAGLGIGGGTGYIQINFTSTHLNNQKWVAIRIKSDNLKAGTTYALQLETTKNSNGGINDIYVIKDTDKTGEDLKNYIQAEITESNKVGKFNSTQVRVVQDMSNVTLEDDSFILAFMPSELVATRCRLLLTYVSLTPVATQSNVASNGSTEYATVAAAIAAAQANEEDKTVTLIDNATENVSVPAGVTLDLNGKTLTATEFSCDGILADKSNGNGMVATVKGKNIKVADSDLLLFDSEKVGYRVYNGFTVAPHVNPESPALQDMPNGAKRLWIKLSFTNKDAYRVIATGNSDLTVGATLGWTGLTDDVKLSFDADDVKDWAGKMAADDGKEYGFYIDFTGFGSLAAGTLTLTPFVNTVSSATSITYNHAG